MSKKLFAFVLAAALLFTAAVSVAAGSFTDVPEDAYYADAAERMAARDILSGYGDGGYYGHESVTRAHVAALACKMLGKVDEAKALAGKTAFTDIKEDSWATGYVNYAHANGIILGDGDGKFRPDEYVKYEEVVKVIVCVLGLDKGVKIDPADWSKEYLEVAEENGLLEYLIGEKGKFMLRSDIAVICDSAMTVLDKQTQKVTTTTTRRVICPSKTTAKTTTATPQEPTTPETEATTATTAVTTATTAVTTETTAATTATTEVTTATTAVTTVTTEVTTATTEVTTVTSEEPEETTKATTATTKENTLPFIPMF